MDIINTKLKKGGAIAALAAMLTLSFVALPAMAAPPAQPVITTLTQSTSTNPIILTGTTDANVSVMVFGGVGTSTASSTASGSWDVSVNLSNNVLNPISVVAFNTSGEFSATTTVNITHDNLAPSAPVVTFPTLPHSTSTTPITIGGTAEADSTISITTGGSSTSTATTTASGSGAWNASVGLNTSSSNMFSVTAMDASGNTSATTTFSVSHFIMATSSPIITLSGAATTTVFACNGYAEQGFSAVDSAGNPITATSSLSISGSVGTEPGTYTLTYSATDDFGHTATTTRTVIVIACSAGGGGGGGGGNNSVPPGLLIAVQNANPNSNVANVLAGFIEGNPPGQVLGASTFQFTVNLRVGSRGTDVAELQRRLTEIGYYTGPITGYFGPLTRAAVIRFQAVHDLPQTGFVGPMTRAVLNS